MGGDVLLLESRPKRTNSGVVPVGTCGCRDLECRRMGSHTLRISRHWVRWRILSSGAPHAPRTHTYARGQNPIRPATNSTEPLAPTPVQPLGLVALSPPSHTPGKGGFGRASLAHRTLLPGVPSHIASTPVGCCVRLGCYLYKTTAHVIPDIREDA